MPIVSVTRMRIRSIRFVPLFYVHAQRVIAQIRQAEGLIAGAVKNDGDLVYWTISLWRDDNAINAFAASGAHRSAMPRLQDWCSEAAMVRWAHDEPSLPDWQEVVERLRTDGQTSKLRHPGPNHTHLNYDAPSAGYSMRF